MARVSNDNLPVLQASPERHFEMNLLSICIPSVRDELCQRWNRPTVSR